jgi:putative spermidine/putrescine transport system permease protein
VTVLTTQTAGQVDATAAASLPRPGGGGLRPLRFIKRYIGIAPFFCYVGLFLIVPTIAVISAAFEDQHGNFTWSNLTAALHGEFIHSFEQSLELSAISAVIAAIFGTLIAVALSSTDSRLLRNIVTTGSGVFAMTGGVPLAFAFIATIGNFGILTTVLIDVLHWNLYDHGFKLYSMLGLIIVYQYFLVPLMALVMLPATEALRREWFEAASILGASRRQAWFRVAAPALAPAFISALMVLFVDAFAAYATAEVLTGGTIALVPLEIGSLVEGNVFAGQQNVGDALGLGMIIVVFIVAVIYALVQRRSARWQR